MKRVLVLAYLFPPIANSGTQRPLKFVKYLAENGWEPIVVTAAQFHGQPVDHKLIDEIPKNVRVHRVPMLNERVADMIAAALGGTALGKRAGEAVRWRMQARRCTPDLYASWIPTALRAAKNIFRETGFDAVFATGYPWSTLQLGREVARATGRPLIVDFRDLWAGDTWPSDQRMAHELELAAERAVVESAAVVVCTSDKMCRLMANTHPSVDEAKFVAIHNGYDADNFADVVPAPMTNKFRIVYTGVWKDVYNPGALYNSIDWIRRSAPEALEHVEVIAAGFRPREARMRGLSRYINEVGILPHREALSLMRSAHLLYLTHEDQDRQWAVPGKLYEYLASGRPVIANTIPDGEAARIIARVGGGKVVSPADPGELYHALLDACRSKSMRVPPVDPDALASFERRALTAKLAAVLSAASNRAETQVPASRMPFSTAAMPPMHPR